MSAAGGLPPSEQAFVEWWAMHRARAAARPTEAEVAEVTRLSTHFPRHTKVIVTPASGPSWRGVVESWTEPGSGRTMAIVRPHKAHGGRAAMHVLPAFVGHVSACTDCRTRQVARPRG